MQFDDSVTFIQGQTAKMYWSVNVVRGPWHQAVIFRSKIESQSEDENTVLIHIEDPGVAPKIHYNKRAADMTLEAQGVSAIANVTFTLANLRRETDEMYYQFRIYDVIRREEDHKFTKLNILGEYCTFW